MNIRPYTGQYDFAAIRPDTKSGAPLNIMHVVKSDAGFDKSMNHHFI